MIQKILLQSSLVLVLCVSSFGVVSAAKATTPTTTTAAAATTSSTTVQGYAADSSLQTGTIVQLGGGSSGAAKVSAASLSKLTQMYGVTVDAHNLSLTLSSASIANEVFVATTGTYPVLVSTQNGAIVKGDYVTISSVDGVGMKANPEQSVVFGRAAADFDGKANVIGSASLKDTGGKVVKKVALGSIAVAIDIRHNPNEKSTAANIPKPLQRLGEAIAEKPVGPIRIYLSIGITGISIVAAIALLYSGVRNSIISIGRNPLSKKPIFRALIEIILTSLIIVIVGLFAVYLLLKL